MGRRKRISNGNVDISSVEMRRERTRLNFFDNGDKIFYSLKRK